MSIIKILGATAIGVVSFGGAASAASVDVFYKFRTAYDVNCAVADCPGAEEGNFEVRFSYDNVTIEESDSYVEGFDAYWLRYSGTTTASITTPVGLVSFQGQGRGDPRIDFEERGAFVELGENISSETEPGADYFDLTGVYNFERAETSVTNGTRSFSFGAGSTFDAPLSFRLTNESGDSLTGDFQMFDAELEIQVSSYATPTPSPVPLPATLPLLAVALGGLGLSVHRRKASRA